MPAASQPEPEAVSRSDEAARRRVQTASNVAAPEDAPRKELLQRVEVLERRLARSDKARRRLEDHRERDEQFLRRVISNLMEAEQQLIERNNELSVQMDETKRANDKLTAAQDQLIRSERRAQEANRAKSNFLANMSHELRTPLNAIIGYSELLIEEGLTDRDQSIEDLGRVLSSGRHLFALVCDILDLSKIEAGRVDVRNECFDLSTFLNEIAESTRGLIEKNKNAFVLDIPSELGSVDTDAVMLRQCVGNLLSNAGKFTRDGAVRLRCTKVDGIIGIEVSDTGIGLTPNQLDSIFDEFIQADSSTTRQYGGTGLGLSITTKLIKLLGGTLSATATLGEGSVFTLTVPKSPRAPLD